MSLSAELRLTRLKELHSSFLKLARENRRIQFVAVTFDTDVVLGVLGELSGRTIRMTDGKEYYLHTDQLVSILGMHQWEEISRYRPMIVLRIDSTLWFGLFSGNGTRMLAQELEELSARALIEFPKPRVEQIDYVKYPTTLEVCKNAIGTPLNEWIERVFDLMQSEESIESIYWRIEEEQNQTPLLVAGNEYYRKHEKAFKWLPLGKSRVRSLKVDIYTAMAITIERLVEQAETIEGNEWIGPKSPGDWEKIFNCTWQTVKNNIKKGLIVADEINSKSWRIRARDIPKPE